MMIRDRYYIVLIVGMTVLITALHFLPFMRHSPDVIFEELYYVPLLIGALVFGLKGAVVTFAFATLLYLPFFFGHWNASFLMTADRFLHVFSTAVFSILAGYLVDREKKRKTTAEKDRYLSGIGQAATTIVHDLKSPLTAIIGFARRIEEGRENPQEAAQLITEAAVKMQSIVNSALDFSRPIKLDLRPESLTDIVSSAIRVCAIKAEEAGVSLVLTPGDNPAPVLADAVQVERAIVNLVTNAIEASRKGQVVSIRVTRRENWLSVKIKDDGVGMDPETIEHVCTPFFTKKIHGTGLGTAIAKKIIEAHGGRLSLQSRPGKGTEVTIDLPIATVGAETVHS